MFRASFSCFVCVLHFAAPKEDEETSSSLGSKMLLSLHHEAVVEIARTKLTGEEITQEVIDSLPQFEIHLPTTMEPHFSIRDFAGMSVSGFPKLGTITNPFPTNQFM